MKYLAYVFALLLLFGCSSTKEAAETVEAPATEAAEEMEEAKAEMEEKAAEKSEEMTEEMKEAMAMKEAIAALSEDRQKLAGWMKQNEKAVATAISGLTPEQWTFHESEDRWSIAEIVEHMIIADAMALAQIDSAVVAGAKPEMKSDTVEALDKSIVAMMRDRTKTYETPESGQPSGKYATPEEALADFAAARKKMMKVLMMEADLRAHFAYHPAVEKEVDIQTWMAFALSHCERHLKQIAEVKADPNYPA
jgi:hypothetical protein